jgi:hypothetical protein
MARKTKSEYGKDEYARIKADPEKYARLIAQRLAWYHKNKHTQKV